jgi:hypothetical protein
MSSAKARWISSRMAGNALFIFATFFPYSWVFVRIAKSVFAEA